MVAERRSLSQSDRVLSLREQDMKALGAPNKREEESFVQHIRLPLKAFSSLKQNEIMLLELIKSSILPAHTHTLRKHQYVVMRGL